MCKELPWIEQELKEAKETEDWTERLKRLNQIAEDIANQFIYEMHLLESDIEDALYEAPEEVKEELGYWDIADVTQDIHINVGR